MGVYKKTMTTTGNPDEYTEKLDLIKHSLYGSSRLGLDAETKLVSERTLMASTSQNGWEETSTQNAVVTITSNLVFERMGEKTYELADYLGNVLVVVSDRKLALGGLYYADIESANRYYPFGMTMPGMTYQSDNYRYGFNGKEKDDEGLGGGGSTYDYGFRIYNALIAKFLSVDPLASTYPFYTPYQFAGNTPIQAIDLDGLEPEYIIDKSGKLTKPMVAVLNTAFLYSTVQLNKAEWVPYTKDEMAKSWAKIVSIPSTTSASVSGYRVIHDDYQGRSPSNWFSLISHEHSHLQDIEESSVSSFYGKYLAEGAVKNYREINTEKKAYSYGSSSGSGLSKKLWDYKGGKVSKVLSSTTMSEADKVKSMEALGNQFRRDVVLQSQIDLNKKIITDTQNYLNTKNGLTSKQLFFNNQVIDQLTKENTSLQNEQKEITTKYGK